MSRQIGYALASKYNESEWMLSICIDDIPESQIKEVRTQFGVKRYVSLKMWPNLFHMPGKDSKTHVINLMPEKKATLPDTDDFNNEQK
jgi:hypothetical protein